MDAMSREAFFSKPETPKTEDVPLADGRVFKIKKLSQGEVEYSKKHYATEDQALQGLRYIVCKCVVDANGHRLFNDEDQPKMVGVDYDVIKQLAEAIIKFSGLNDNAKKD